MLFEFADDATRKVYRYAEDGTTVISERPYTDEENAGAAARAARAVEDTNRRTIDEMLDQDFIDLQGLIAMTNAAINQNPAAVMKPVMRILRRMVRHARGDFTGTD